jgi:hypothetical protein
VAERISLPGRDKLPTVSDAIVLIQKAMERPIPRLHDTSIWQLFQNAKMTDVTRVWVVGSQAWYPLIKGRTAPADRDWDFVFADEGTHLDFLQTVVDLMRLKGEAHVQHEEGPELHRVSSTKVVGRKLKMKRTYVMDCWALPPQTTIAEHVCGFRDMHERCAVLVGATYNEIGAVTRISHPERYDQYADLNDGRDYGS